jgi:hypothetical protein
MSTYEPVSARDRRIPPGKKLRKAGDRTGIFGTGAVSKVAFGSWLCENDFDAASSATLIQAAHARKPIFLRRH